MAMTSDSIVLSPNSKQQAHALWESINRASSVEELEQLRAEIEATPMEVQAAMMQALLSYESSSRTGQWFENPFK